VARAAEPKTGRLDVNTFPWARVFVDGVYRGDTPVQRLRLAAGVHELRVVNPDQRLSRTLSVVIVAGETVRQVIRLRR
jgi:serine/threonine-protein kinase